VALKTQRHATRSENSGIRRLPIPLQRRQLAKRINPLLVTYHAPLRSLLSPMQTEKPNRVVSSRNAWLLNVIN
jgi:hypothetical protein